MIIPRKVRWLRSLIPLLLAVTQIVSMAQPANDNFADRIKLVGPNHHFTSFPSLGTAEPGETAGWGICRFCGSYIPASSLWWSWTAEADGVLEIVSVQWGGGLLNDVSLFEGESIPTLKPVQAINTWGGGYLGAVKQGHRYAIQAAGNSSTHFWPARELECWVSFFPRPQNDLFANRAPMVGLPARVSGSLTGSGWELEESVVSEQADYPTGSIWWKWTAPISGSVSFTLESSPALWRERGYFGGSFESLVLELGTGKSADTPNFVASTPVGPWPSSLFDGTQQVPTTRSFSWNVVQGQEYVLRVGGQPEPSTVVSVAIRTGTPPNLTGLLPAPGSVFMQGDPITNSVSIQETGTADAPRTVEFAIVPAWRWQAVGTVYTQTISQPPYVAVWTNLPPASYNLITRLKDELGSLDSFLHGVLSVRPINDQLATALKVTGNFLTITGTVASSPICIQGDTQCGTWWKWTAPESGRYTVTPEVEPGRASLQLSVFEIPPGGAGSPVLRGTSTAANDFLIENSSISVSLDAVAGRDYAILASRGFQDGEFRIHIRPWAAPSVEIVSPREGQHFRNEETINIAVNASSAGGPIQRVDYFSGFDQTRWDYYGTSSTPPYTLQIPPNPEGLGFWIIAKAFATDGSIAVSRPLKLARDALKPPNDNFADRTPIAAGTSWVSQPAGFASLEAGEPFTAFSPTVWWSFVAPSNGSYTLEVATTNLPACFYGESCGFLAGVFTGTNVAALVPTPGTTNWMRHQPIRNASFAAAEGTTYALGIVAPWSSALRLRVVPGSPPVIALLEASPHSTVSGGAIQMEALASDPDGDLDRVEFYFGNSLIGSVSNAPFQMSYRMVATNFSNLPTCYELRAVAFDALGLSSEAYRLSDTLCATLPPPPNDLFANRQVITTTHTLANTPPTVGTTLGSTTEPGDPVYYLPTHDVWYSWTAPHQGRFTVTLGGRPLRPATSEGLVLEVFRGENLSSLESVGTNVAFTALSEGPTGMRVIEVDAKAGETYSIAVGGTLDSFLIRVWDGPAPQGWVDHAQISPDRRSFFFQFDSTLGKYWQIQDSTNLLDWRSLPGYPPAIGSVTVTDTNDPPSRMRFYRAIRVP